jgi:hypothetical protein
METDLDLKSEADQQTYCSFILDLDHEAVLLRYLNATIL